MAHGLALAREKSSGHQSHEVPHDVTL